mmetsp:Transcript_8779/g.15695  ORF Transcript_8779/g.15695 Transcript_8779/m.15695 type:complete len:387 (-) Transcript_8779:582-1742(-)
MEDLVVVAHVSGQHHLQGGVPHFLPLLRAEGLQQVELGVLHQLEHGGAMVVLQYRAVIVQQGQVGVRADVEVVVEAGVVEVVDGARDDGCEGILGADLDDPVHTAWEQNVVEDLRDVSRVGGVVVCIRVVARLDRRAPVEEHLWIDAVVLDKAVLVEQTVGDHEQGPTSGMLLQCEDVEIPFINLFHTFQDVLMRLIGCPLQHLLDIWVLDVPGRCSPDARNRPRVILRAGFPWDALLIVDSITVGVFDELRGCLAVLNEGGGMAWSIWGVQRVPLRQVIIPVQVSGGHLWVLDTAHLGRKLVTFVLGCLAHAQGVLALVAQALHLHNHSLVFFQSNGLPGLHPHCCLLLRPILLVLCRVGLDAEIVVQQGVDEQAVHVVLGGRSQ